VWKVWQQQHFVLVGVDALVRLEKLIKTLKEKGVLEHDYKDE
tara:strand:- start:789 stop:914 length:126 start_codon:yes stop_codon:yes gene_type:complete